MFGQVVSGLEVLDEMATVPTDDNDIPTRRTEVYDMRLVRENAPVPQPKPAERRQTADPVDPEAGTMERAIRRFW